MFNKLLIISGPTATGKTALAVKIVKKYHGELVSADSRQVYRGLDIGVGKDHPSETPIRLIDLIDPDQSFSVAQYRQLALAAITSLQASGKLPILVGCSGFYIDSIVNPDYNTFSVKPKFILRSFLFKLPVKIQQLVLKCLDPKVYKSLNNSDISNPLRLIRKIEIALSPFPQRGIKGDLNFDILHLSLTAPNQFLYHRIDNRVDDRLKIGHLQELRKLLERYHWSDPGLKVSAYYSFKQYFAKKRSLAESIQRWRYCEHRDARRQKTWFKKREHIKFINITTPNSVELATETVEKWYNES